MEIIKIDNVSFTYPNAEQKVINQASFSIFEGEFVVMFGESGSGKTSLLKLLKRELAPHGTLEGEIYYKNKNMNEFNDRQLVSEIGYVMQNPEHQIVTDKVWHELAFGLENLGMETSIIRRRVGEMANFFGIHHWFHKKTMDLSGGQKQILNLAATMVMQPKILILDEPTAQLDPIASAEFLNILHKINRDLGVTVLLVEHVLDEVFSIADRVLFIEDGRILLNESPHVIGAKLKEINDSHHMLEALPTIVRIFNELTFNDPMPLTVRDGRRMLSKYYRNDIAQLEEDEIPLDDTPIIQLKNVSFRYERESPDILYNTNLTINKGEIISILGGNGSGKTTLLQVMSGQNRPYRGNVFVKGKKLKTYKGRDLYKNLLAVLPQDPQTMFIKSTVRDDYEEISKVMGYSKEEIEKQIELITNQLNINLLLERHPYDLSGGEQQKTALGKILLLKPQILLLDEPTKGIDAFSKLVLKDILLGLKATGKTIILVTHDIEFASIVSDRTGLFFDKDIISIDTPRKFFSQNNFYTTMANRISRHRYENAITAKDVINICQLNGRKQYELA